MSKTSKLCLSKFYFVLQLIPLLMASLLEDSLPVYSSLYQKMVDLLVYLNKSSTEDDTERATAALATLSTIIESLRQLDIIEKNNEKCIRRYAAFLCTFKDRNSPRLTKTVRFSGTDAEKPVENARKSRLTFQQILDLVCDVCIRAYEQSLAHRSVATVEFFNEMIKAYDVDNIYNVIWKMSCLEILGDVIVPWIVEYGDMIQNKRIYEAFVGIITTLFLQCTPADKVLFLSKAMEVGSVLILQGMVFNLSHTCLCGICFLRLKCPYVPSVASTQTVICPFYVAFSDSLVCVCVSLSLSLSLSLSVCVCVCVRGRGSS